MIPVRTVEAVYEKGYLRPLEPLEAREGVVYIVTVLDIASIQTFLNGGKVFAIHQEKMPGNKLLAAVFRY